MANGEKFLIRYTSPKDPAVWKTSGIELTDASEAWGLARNLCRVNGGAERSTVIHPNGQQASLPADENGEFDGSGMGFDNIYSRARLDAMKSDEERAPELVAIMAEILKS